VRAHGEDRLGCWAAAGVHRGPAQRRDKRLRPDGVIRVEYGRAWTALVEVKTGRNELIREQIEAYLELARRHKFDVLLTISNQLRQLVR
jgi:hypothetical protein